MITQLLNWPNKSTFTIRMTKEALKDTDKKTLKDKTLAGIEKMQWLGALKPEHIALPSFINEEFYFDEIIAISVHLSNKTDVNKYALLLQKAIPYPLVIAFWCDNFLCINLAEKRIHQQQKDKRVVKQENLIFSDWININEPNERTESYLQNLSLANVGGKNLKEYYDNLINNILDEHRQNQLQNIALDKEINVLKNKYYNESNKSKKTEIHLKIQELIQKKQNLLNK
jgi:hypothetical protein